MIEPGLERISRLLAKTPLPWRAIHVAGTNGKGSICAYVSSMLETYNKSHFRKQTGFSPLRHARFTSPHLIDRWDCITINQNTVPPKLFAYIEERVLRRNEELDIKASEFELLTATAFEIFTQQQVDVCVVEVGMGGELDATNIIGQRKDFSAEDVEHFRPPPLVTAISRIGLDHQAFLGKTLPAIAQKKAGIFKRDVPAIWDHSNEDITANSDWTYNTLRREAYNSGADYPPDGDHSYPLTDRRFQKIMPFIGAEHVKENLAVAIRSTCIALTRLGKMPRWREELRVPVEDFLVLQREMISNALKHANLPGRQQRLSIEKMTGRKEDILLDGAHNAQSAEVLGLEVANERHIALETNKPKGEAVTWVLACSSTKDVKEILMPLLQAGDMVFTVEFGPVDGMPWVQPTNSDILAQGAAQILHESGGRGVLAQACGNDVLKALRLASNDAKGGTLVVAGSLYLVGDVLRRLRDHEEHAQGQEK